MVKREYYMTRNDGVKLYKTIDAIVDENGEPAREEKGNLIPTGNMIIQQPTNVEYTEAIDVATYINGNYYPKAYSYIETDKDIETI